MQVLLVYNDGLVESFDTREDPTQEYTHAQLVTFVEEADEGEDRYEVGIDLIPVIHSKSRDLHLGPRAQLPSLVRRGVQHDQRPQTAHRERRHHLGRRARSVPGRRLLCRRAPRGTHLNTGATNRGKASHA